MNGIKFTYFKVKTKKGSKAKNQLIGIMRVREGVETAKEIQIIKMTTEGIEIFKNQNPQKQKTHKMKGNERNNLKPHNFYRQERA